MEIEMVEHGGGRAGIHNFGWRRAGYNLDELEPLRQQLLRANDYGQVQKSMRQLGINVDRATLQAVKRYNFDSQGVGFRYDNYTSWRKLATGKGTIGDAAYLVHEIAEVKELQRIQQKSGFDFMGKYFDTLPRRRQGPWKHDFNRYYKASHSKALEAEYEFVVEQIIKVTNGSVKISVLQAAAIDPTRRVRLGSEDTEAALHMLVDGMAMKQHPHFNAWYQRGDEIVALSASTQQRLEYYSPQTTIKKLIEYVKKMRIK